MCRVATDVRLYRLAAEVLGAIELGVFHPNVGWQCKDCQFQEQVLGVAVAFRRRRLALPVVAAGPSSHVLESELRYRKCAAFRRPPAVDRRRATRTRFARFWTVASREGSSAAGRREIERTEGLADKLGPASLVDDVAEVASAAEALPYFLTAEARAIA